MKINDTDIRVFNARQSRITVGHHDWTLNTDWLPGAVLPMYGTSGISVKPIKVVINIKGASRTSIISQRSELLALLTGVVTLQLDNYEHKFCAVMKNHKETEMVKRRWHQLELDFEGYEYGDDVTVETASAMAGLTVTNPGNIVSPCKVEITPRAGAESITLTGLCRDSFTGEDLPVIIDELVIGEKVIIDAMTGKVTQDGSLKDIDIWALPSLKPGANTVSCNNSSMTVKVTVTPFYE